MIPFYFLSEKEIMAKLQKTFFAILVQTALFVGQYWTIQIITPKFALLSLDILYFHCIDFKHFTVSNQKFYGDFKYE